MAALPSCQHDLDIQLLLAVMHFLYLFAVKPTIILRFLPFKWNNRAWSLSEDNVRFSYNAMLFSRNTWIFVQVVLWMICCLSYFHLHVFVWMISCLFVSYDKFLWMWMVSASFSLLKSRKYFYFLFCNNFCWVIDMIA